MDRLNNIIQLAYDSTNTNSRVLLHENLDNLDAWVNPKNHGGLDMGFTKEQEKPLGYKDFFDYFSDLDNPITEEHHIEDLSAWINTEKNS